MVPAFKSLLYELDASLRRYNPSAYETLRPPLPEQEIDRHLEELGIADEQVKVLYSWKSSGANDDEVSMTSVGGLLGFDDIETWKGYLSDTCDPCLVPLFGNDSDGYLFNTRKGPHYGKLYFFSVSCLYIDHPISIFDSLPAMVQTLIEAYEQGVYESGADGWLEIDSRRFTDIALRMSPEAAFWKEHDPLMWEEWYAV